MLSQPDEHSLSYQHVVTTGLLNSDDELLIGEFIQHVVDNMAICL
jgi:hypothetical protein